MTYIKKYFECYKLFLTHDKSMDDQMNLDEFKDLLKNVDFERLN